jgi:glycosyltransferase involved in cell wall biosynthesis
MGAAPDPSHSLTYLCLQPMRQGQASYTHVNEIAAGLRRLRWVVRVISTPATGRATLIRRLFWTIITQWRLVRQGPADVLYVRSHPAAILCTAWARARRIPVVQEVNGPADDFTAAWPGLRPLRWLIAWSLRWQLRRAGAVITVTEGLRAWAEEVVAGNALVSVVPNGANPAHFAPSAASSRRLRPYVLFFGALAPWQGLDTLLEAALGPAWPPEVALVVAGDGPERPHVEEAERRANGRIVYVGSLPYVDMPPLISGSIAAIIPKNYHRPELGLSPLKLYEAMACQVPVIVTNLPGLGDVVEAEDCGVVVEVGAAIDLARAVGLLHAAPELAKRLGERGRLAIVERHSWAHRSAATNRIVSSLATSSRKRGSLIS